MQASGRVIVHAAPVMPQAAAYTYVPVAALDAEGVAPLRQPAAALARRARARHCKARHGVRVRLAVDPCNASERGARRVRVGSAWRMAGWNGGEVSGGAAR